MANKHNRPHKDKKKRGHVQAELLIPKKIAIEEGLDQEGQFWDDWSDWRDSMRAWFADRTRFYKVWSYRNQPFDVDANNKRLKTREKIRKARKEKNEAKNAGEKYV